MLRFRACPADARSVQVKRYCWLLQDCKLSLPRVHLRRASRWSLSDPGFCRTGCTCGAQHNYGTLQTARSISTLGSHVFALQPPAPIPLVSPKVATTNTSDGLPARALPLRQPAGSAIQVTGGKYPLHKAFGAKQRCCAPAQAGFTPRSVNSHAGMLLNIAQTCFARWG